MIAAHLANEPLTTVLTWSLAHAIEVVRRTDAVGALLNPFYSKGEEPIMFTAENAAMVASQLGAVR